MQMAVNLLCPCNFSADRLTEPLSPLAAVSFRIDGGHQLRLIDGRKKSYRFVSRKQPAKSRVIIRRELYERRSCSQRVGNALFVQASKYVGWIIGSFILIAVHATLQIIRTVSNWHQFAAKFPFPFPTYKKKTPRREISSSWEILFSAGKTIT